MGKINRTDDFMSTRKFITLFARKNLLEISGITPYDFADGLGNHARGYMVKFGAIGLDAGSLNFVNGNICRDSEYDEDGQRKTRKLICCKNYQASGKLGGKRVNFSATVERVNTKSPNGHWRSPEEYVTVDKKSRGYWFYD